MSHIFYKILKKIREESPYTQQQIADMLGVTIKQYQNYEKKTIPPHDNLLKLNEILKTDLSILIYQGKVPNGIETDVTPLYTMEELKIKIEEQSETIRSQQESILELVQKIPKVPDINETVKNV